MKLSRMIRMQWKLFLFKQSWLLLVFLTLLQLETLRAEKVRVIELTNAWQLQNSNGSISIGVPRIPSGVYTALKSLYGDVLESENDVKLRWISYDNWTYTKLFAVNEADYEHVRAVNLTLHGVDTVATVRLNGQIIGQPKNMFLRYSFNVLPYLRPENTLEIEITSPVWAAEQLATELAQQNLTAPPLCDRSLHYAECHRNMLRKMQASFGTEDNLAAPSMGIWKPVTLEYYDTAIMRDIDVATQEGTKEWIMDIRVFLITHVTVKFWGELTFFAPELLDEPIIRKELIDYKDPRLELRVAIPKEKIKLWWPNGFGAQTLYPLFFTMNCWLGDNGVNVRAKSVSQKSLKIGFRTIELIEDEDTDKLGRTFYFKVNGHPIFIKGANYLPSHILPELSTDQDRIDHILSSAKESHLNMIRVWGGGLYESDFFYSTADRYGLLVWQDMAFTAATYPVTTEFLESVRQETVQNAQRIAYHPSLALIVTNDEVELYLVQNKSDFGEHASRLEEEYKQLFRGTIRYELKVLDRNEFSPRPGPMISTPSIGIALNKYELAQDPQDLNFGDIHWWNVEEDGFDPNVYPRARFVSSYGFQSLPVMSSWHRILGPNDTVADMISHRQHSARDFKPMVDLINRHFPLSTENWDENVDSFIYFSQLSQAMAVKTATEVFRSNREHYRTMGAIYWHLNDAWVSPACSSIDFYGNYKILYYWSKKFLTPTTIIPLYDATANAVNITLLRDDFTEASSDARAYDVTVNIYLWSELYAKKTLTWSTILNKNDVQKRVLSLDNILMPPYNVNNTFLEFILSQNDTALASTFVFPGTISDAIGIRDPKLTVELTRSNECKKDAGANMRSYSLTIRVQAPAIFIYLEIVHPSIVRYKLSQNGFVQVEPVKMIHLEFEQKTHCVNVEPKHIKVSTLNQFMVNSVAVQISEMTMHTLPVEEVRKPTRGALYITKPAEKW